MSTKTTSFFSFFLALSLFLLFQNNCAAYSWGKNFWVILWLQSSRAAVLPVQILSVHFVILQHDKRNEFLEWHPQELLAWMNEAWFFSFSLSLSLTPSFTLAHFLSNSTTLKRGKMVCSNRSFCLACLTVIWAGKKDFCASLCSSLWSSLFFVYPPVLPYASAAQRLCVHGETLSGQGNPLPHISMAYENVHMHRQQ